MEIVQYTAQEYEQYIKVQLLSGRTFVMRCLGFGSKLDKGRDRLPVGPMFKI